MDLFSYLFGSILVISKSDLIISIVLSVIVILTIVLFYNTLFAITYDEEFAKTMGIGTRNYNYLISILTSITIVLGIRVVGTMLVSSMIIFPTITALQLSKGFKLTIFISVLISVLSVVLGVFTSYIYDLPTGATVVLLNAAWFIIMFGIKKIAF